MATYYIDPLRGTEPGDGLSPEAPKKSIKDISIQPGDIIRFACGRVYRESLHLAGGKVIDPVTYTTYGEGPMPVFIGSEDVSDPADWVEEAPHIWRCIKPINGDVGNFIFNDDECTATLRWTEEELSGQGDFYDSRFGEGNQHLASYSPQRLLLCSKINPGKYYDHIEAVAYGDRILCRLESNVIIDGLCFKNSGVHAIAGDHGADNVTVRNCRIENIGGVVWNRDLKIRFGNGFEIWQYANDILVENYDNTGRQIPGRKADVDQRSFRDSKLCFTEEQVKAETARCLGCGASIVDPNQCVGCGICTTKCEFDAIHLKRDIPEASTMRKAEDKLKYILPNGAKQAIKIKFSKKKK